MPEMEVEYFEKAGPENTPHALQIAKAYAEKNGIKDIICASTTGTTGLQLIEKFNSEDYSLIIVTHATGFAKIDVQEFLPENRTKIESTSRAKILTATHAFSGISRSFRNELKAFTSTEIIARLLRSVFGDGLKVCIEITLMAADAGLISCSKEKEILAIGGTGKGADTVALIRPAYTANFLDLRVKRILCKPSSW
ncbi:MAG: hypothetical protein LUQ65_10200 [Candidatus Helarchaeota archaeon]|nr:hypothetical protein [Candidatus Helarchaeota archaeon]